MSKFNPLDHPICLSSPLWLGKAWAGHVPFAMTLVDLVRPRMIVELGTTFDGVSYCAFCQAVRELRLDTQSYAVTGGDFEEQSGNDQIKELKEHHDSLYGRFSRFVQGSSAKAISIFDDDAIDLLHLRAAPSYQSARREFEMCLPKISASGVVVLSNTNLHEGDRGHGKLWSELKLQYRHFDFAHEGGLGLLAVGASVSAELQKLVDAREPNTTIIREFFRQQGHRISQSQNEARLEEKTGPELEERLRTLLPAALETSTKELEREREFLRSVLGELEFSKQAHETAQQQLSTATSQLQTAQEELATATGQLRTSQEELATVTGQLQHSREQLSGTTDRLNAILNSRAWRWVTRYGRVKNRLFGSTHHQRGGPD